jgi:hypothetical protein
VENVIRPRFNVRSINDRSAMIQVIEFIIVFSVFVLLLSAFFSSIATQIPSNNIKDVDTRMRANEICETLVRDTGMMMDGDRNWELREIPEINYGNSPLQRLGLSKDTESYGVISLAKVLALQQKVLYTRASEILNLKTGLLLNISVDTLEPMDDATDLHMVWGAQPTATSKNFISYTKVVIVDNGYEYSASASRPQFEKATITITLFYTGKI